MGIKIFFEKNGDVYFKLKFKEYVIDYLLYYVKLFVMRFVYFVVVLYYWGNKKINRIKLFSLIKRDGEILELIIYIVRVFWGELLFVMILFIFFIVLILLILIDRYFLLICFIFLNYLYVFFIYILIYVVINYVYLIIFCNILLFVYFFYGKKWEFLIKKL